MMHRPAASAIFDRACLCVFDAEAIADDERLVIAHPDAVPSRRAGDLRHERAGRIVDAKRECAAERRLPLPSVNVSLRCSVP